MIQNRLNDEQRETVGAVTIVFAYTLLAGINAFAVAEGVGLRAWWWVTLNALITCAMIVGGTWEALRYRDARRRRKADTTPTG